MISRNIWRIRVEKEYIGKELPHFNFRQTGDVACFYGLHTPSKGFQSHLIQIDLPTGFPDQSPNLYVLSPLILWKHGGGTINSIGSSSNFHTLSNGPGGCVQICHDANWDASKTCFGVLCKGILWIEAYAEHVMTGETIFNILNRWERGQK